MAKEPFVARLTCIWIGGFLVWVFRGFRGNLSAVFAENYNNRNFWIGYVVTMLLVLTGVILVVLKAMKM